MAKVLIKKLGEYQTLYRNPLTGIAWVENGSTGCAHSAHPNIDATGSVRGMKSRGYWGKEDRCVRSNGAIYNISICTVHDDLDQVAADHCHCGGNHGRVDTLRRLVRDIRSAPDTIDDIDLMLKSPLYFGTDDFSDSDRTVLRRELQRHYGIDE